MYRDDIEYTKAAAMLISTVTRAGQVRRFTVTSRETGWEAREEHGSQIVRTVQYSDWHRVERAIEVFQLQGRDSRVGSDYSTKR